MSSVKSIFILSLSSEIGEELALRFLEQGCRVAGTYRSSAPERLAAAGVPMLRVNLEDESCGKSIRGFLEEKEFHWDLLISAVGQLSPIGKFLDVDFSEWETSVRTNSLAQLGVLHAIWPCAAKDMKHAAFFAGGGTNNPFPNYSAYCLGKIALIKMCELLDDEIPDLNPFIIGTGWVRTKIHLQTLAAGNRAGNNFEVTSRFMEQNPAATGHEDVFAMIEWCVQQGKQVAGGRNFSIVHDPWRNGGGNLATELLADQDKYRLRRAGNKSISQP